MDGNKKGSSDLPALHDLLRELYIPTANGSKAVYGELCYFQLCDVKHRKVALWFILFGNPFLIMGIYMNLKGKPVLSQLPIFLCTHSSLPKEAPRVRYLSPDLTRVKNGT